MVTLGDFVGKWLVVYVYPKDDTPGCTIQGKSFTATKQEFDDANIAVVGVSADDVESHKNFCNKFSFTIDLLADPDHELLDAAGVGQSDYKGTMYWNRTSFVIDPAGTLRKVYEKVNPEGHERVLLDDIKAMQGVRLDAAGRANLDGGLTIKYHYHLKKRRPSMKSRSIITILSAALFLVLLTPGSASTAPPVLPNPVLYLMGPEFFRRAASTSSATITTC